MPLPSFSPIPSLFFLMGWDQGWVLAFPLVTWVSLFTGLDYWTGL